MWRLNKKYWQIAKRLSTAQLQLDSYDDAYITDMDLFNTESGGRGHNFFLGFYSHKGFELIVRKYGILKTLEEIGFKNVEYKIDTSDLYIHKVTFYDKKRMLIEAVLKRESKTLDLPFYPKADGKRITILSIEWLSMQNPDADFSIERPRLPGQQYPGLGLASRAVELLMIAAWRLKLAGLVNKPQQYHNAFLYSKIFYYLNPEHQAKLMAISRDTKRYPLNKTAWAVEWGALIDEVENKPFVWSASEQIVPLDIELKKAFNSWEYRRLVKKLSEKYKFRIDEDKYIKIKKIKEDQ